MSITLYTAPSCGPCAATKAALNKKGIPFTVVDVSTDPAAVEKLQGMGYQRAPVVVVREDWHWSGFQLDLIDRLAAEIEAGTEGEA